MTEFVPNVGDTATFIRKSGDPIRGEVLKTENGNYILDVNGRTRTVLKSSVRKILA
jgi:hypothetical protein